MEFSEAVLAAATAQQEVEAALERLSKSRMALAAAENELRRGRIAADFPVVVAVAKNAHTGDDAKFCTVTCTRGRGARPEAFSYIFAPGVGRS